jgi:hypothetical protein
MSRRGLAFSAVTAACIVLAAGYVTFAATRGGDDDADLRPTTVRLPTNAGPTPLRGTRRLLVRRSDHGKPVADPRVSRVVIQDGVARVRPTGLRCRRVDLKATAGLCLVENRSGIGYTARVLDGRLRTRHAVALTGVPSRARVSPDGRWGAVTTFTTGDSYAQPGQFSTRAVIIEMASGKVVGELERFRLMRGSERIDAPDVNLWGITFASDDDTFYATLRTGSHTYLMKGSISGRSAATVRENVECPSLSPDGTRIAYKHAESGRGHWRLHVLDLATMHDVALAETRSVDDQAEWLDDGNVLYATGGDVWTAEADGGGRPQRLLPGEESPAVTR